MCYWSPAFKCFKVYFYYCHFLQEYSCFFFFLMIRPPPRSPLFPYPTLFRSAPAAESAMARYQYLPFGGGPRICIGMGFAMIETTAIVATLLQHAEFVPVGGDEPHPVDRKSTRLNSSHSQISYAVFCLKKKNQ